MITYKKLLSLGIIVSCMSLHFLHAATIKSADEVFKKWTSWQRIMPQLDLTAMTHNITQETFAQTIKQQYEKTAPTLTPVATFLQRFTANHISEDGYHFRSPLNEDFIQNLTIMYHLIQNDMVSFVEILKAAQFETKTNYGTTSNDVIETYNALMKVLFSNFDENDQSAYLFSVANKFYEYCFSEKTFPHFQKLLLDKSSHPIARMLYAVSWFNLAGNGWKHWHEDSLRILHEKAKDQNHRVVYIAGGSDIYQLLRAGVYNIKNIDPQLPSQPKYYADDWTYVLKGELGDTIVFTSDAGKITMQRTEFYEHGTTFKARIATGDIIEIPHSTTVWTIFDHEGVKLGSYTLERRFCEQADFMQEPNKTLLMSFNELYFIALPGFLNGWNIDTSRFNENCSIVVKQLSKPVTKQMVMNMRIASMLNATDFKFIALGTCIN